MGFGTQASAEEGTFHYQNTLSGERAYCCHYYDLSVVGKNISSSRKYI